MTNVMCLLIRHLYYRHWSHTVNECVIRVCGGGRVCSSPNLSMLSVSFFDKSQTCVGMNDEHPSQRLSSGAFSMFSAVLWIDFICCALA